MSNQPYQEGPEAARDRSTEHPGNFKRTPPTEEVEQDPLDSGPRFTSNQVLIGTVVSGSVLGAILALIYL